MPLSTSFQAYHSNRSCISWARPVHVQGPKNLKILTPPPAILHLSNSKTKKENPLALTKFFLVRPSRRVDYLDSDVLGYVSEVSSSKTHPQIAQRIQCGCLYLGCLKLGLFEKHFNSFTQNPDF